MILSFFTNQSHSFYEFVRMHAIHHDLHDYIYKFMKTQKQEKLGEKYIVHGSLSCECSTTWILNVRYLDRSTKTGAHDVCARHLYRVARPDAIRKRHPRRVAAAAAPVARCNTSPGPAMQLADGRRDVRSSTNEVWQL
jgi:hypothetical protein